MYIRRKVFSQAMDWDNGYEMEERLYSTGDYELDEILERAFCEGYEAAQREFADDSYDELIGAGIGAGAVGLGAAGAYGYHKGSNALINNRIEAIGKKEGLTAAEIEKRQKAWREGKIAKTDKWLGKHLGKTGTVATKVSGWADKALNKMAETVPENSKKWEETVKKYVEKGYKPEKAVEMAKKKLGDGKIKSGAKKAGRWVAEKVKNNPRAAAAAAAGIAAAGIGAGAGYAHRKMKED
jgi:hypothetical protein